MKKRTERNNKNKEVGSLSCFGFGFVCISVLRGGQPGEDVSETTSVRGSCALHLEGAAPSRDALEALREAVNGYQARKQQITRLAALALPLAFSAALLAAFLFASFVIPALPQDWRWPCKVIGAEFRQNVDAQKTTSFCVIVRE